MARPPGARNADHDHTRAALARAAAGALAALAVASSADAAAAASASLLKPANHAALLATRDDAPAARAAALAAVGALATAAGGDYLPLLPDALPFLGELLEDGDDGVARRARALVDALEGAAGESLDPYLKA
jgi:U3 small nucleolar RNA-associated protein 10